MFENYLAIMLPTENRSKLHYHKDNHTLTYGNIEIDNSYIWVNQHLYILSDDHIDVGDWYYVPKVDKVIKHYGTHEIFTTFFKKVIATTDKSLNIDVIPDEYVENYCKIYKS